jgi:hypothetical protein
MQKQLSHSPHVLLLLLLLLLLLPLLLLLLPLLLLPLLLLLLPLLLLPLLLLPLLLLLLLTWLACRIVRGGWMVAAMAVTNEADICSSFVARRLAAGMAPQLVVLQLLMLFTLILLGECCVNSRF